MNIQALPIPRKPIRLAFLIFVGLEVPFALNAAVRNVWNPWTETLKTSTLSLLFAYCGVGFALAVRRPMAWRWFWSCFLFGVVPLGVFVVAMIDVEWFMRWISVIYRMLFSAAALLIVSGIIVATLGWRDWWVSGGAFTKSD